MARKPNYDFERRERERLKAIKVAEKAEAKRAARERAKLGEGVPDRTTANRGPTRADPTEAPPML